LKYYLAVYVSTVPATLMDMSGRWKKLFP